MKLVVTGGAGFIGTHCRRVFAQDGYEVVAFDNLSRQGSEENLARLRASLGGSFRFVKGDVRCREDVDAVIHGADVVLHCAAQVAVTASVVDPVTDFDINARGTLNVLEAVRARAPRAVVGFASTNCPVSAPIGHTA